MVKLDILSDPVCPWCYIGKTYLERAMEKAGDHPFIIEWHPYQLDPTIPEGGVERTPYMERKFGGKEGWKNAYMPLVEHATKAGVQLNHDLITRVPNTLDAHRLIHWAGIEQKQTFVVNALFKAYWVEGRDIGDHEVLVDIASKAGLDGDMIGRLLASDADKDDIKARQEHSRKMGVSSVPTFVVANQHVVQGAQPASLWENVIADLNTQLAERE